MTTVLQASALSAYYQRDVAVLDNLDFSLQAGEHLGLSGASGAGKTTLLRLAAGIALAEKGMLTKGEFAAFAKTDLLAGSQALRKAGYFARIGMVSEDPIAGLHPQRTIAQTWKLLAGRPASELITALVQFGITAAASLVDRYPHQISGGEAQRVRLVLATAHKPGLLLLESPTASLDADSTQLVLAEIDRQADAGTAVLHVSHDDKLLSQVASRRLQLIAGRLHKVVEVPIVQPARLPIPNTAATVLSISNLRFNYRAHANDRDAISVNQLTLKAGEALGISGRSGSGKTTLGKAIAGLLDAHGEVQPSRRSGDGKAKILLQGRPITGLDARIQYIWQEPRLAINPCFTVRQTLQYALQAAQSSARRQSTPEALLRAVSLSEELLHRSAISLSTGQMQRLTIARTLAVEPLVLVCDEIMAGLDAANQISLFKTLNQLQATQGVAIVWIAHDVELMRQFCHRVLTIENGEVQREELFPATS